tara:strand:- start:4419 stop:5420 length:1002 start_codon:yes stop_codon:yes gene_type:complete
MKTLFSQYLEKRFKKNKILINSNNLNELYHRFENTFKKMSSDFLSNIERIDSIYNNTHSYKNNIIFKTKTVINILNNNQKININIYYNNDKIDDFINYILFVIHFMLKYSNFNENFQIDYLLTDHKKEINSKERGQIFTENEINSGLTYFNKNKIIIWRKEEIFKVTIHELIHLFRLGTNQNYINLVNHYKKIYSISSKYVLIDEAYTEFLAILVNSYLISKFLKKTYNYFVYLLKLEINFTKYQCEKIIYLSRKNNVDIIDINKHTQVLSYFFIKYDMFKNIDNMIKLILINNLNDIEKILIDSKSIRYNKINKNNKEFKTMRMSLNEVKLF